MAGTQDTLVELLDQILQSCARYQRVERFLAQARPAELESRISSLDSEIAQASGAETRGFLEREREALRGQLAAHRRLMGVAEDFRARLQAMTRQLEALRARLETMRANVSARWEDIPLERVLAELDDELVVFEQTFEDIEMTAPAMTVGR
jgi:chromosome segregation ATPase